MLTIAQKMRIQDKLNRMVAPSYLELDCNKSSLLDKRPKRMALRQFVGKHVRYAGRFKAVRQYHTDSIHGVHVLIKPAIVAGIKLDHIWLRVPNGRFNRVFSKVDDKFKPKVQHLDHITRVPIENVFVRGQAEVTKYTKNLNKTRYQFSEDYGFKVADNFSLVPHSLLGDLLEDLNMEEGEYVEQIVKKGSNNSN